MTGASDIAVRRFDAVAPGRPMGRAGSKDTGRVACQPTHGRGPSLGPATSPSLQGWGALTAASLCPCILDDLGHHQSEAEHEPEPVLDLGHRRR